MASIGLNSQSLDTNIVRLLGVKCKSGATISFGAPLSRSFIEVRGDFSPDFMAIWRRLGAMCRTEIVVGMLNSRNPCFFDVVEENALFPAN